MTEEDWKLLESVLWSWLYSLNKMTREEALPYYREYLGKRDIKDVQAGGVEAMGKLFTLMGKVRERGKSR